ncbi:hypothetical protein [Actinoplanes sp. ATCC 53533]|uniref:hypothetical protein n=1 Tax=Actinoplanes sp. ATCC 53533 TaxID=1288362 RepID=UPI0013151714|nr:hypothetical protein [Actinoplanes sp. ATCC 53533]
MDVLSRRELNRATLARQQLLERAPAGALDMIEHLAGRRPGLAGLRGRVAPP